MKKNKCKRCDGKGEVPYHKLPCSMCDGTGFYYKNRECKNCKGTGKVDVVKEICNHCEGRGYRDWIDNVIRPDSSIKPIKLYGE